MGTMMHRIVFVALLLGVAHAFAPSPLPTKTKSVHTSPTTSANQIRSLSHDNNRLLPTTTSLSERQWNFNEGRAPWGLKRNAEIWNGRVAQMAFVFTLFQETITGKGVISSFRDGDVLAYVCLGFAVVSTLGLTVWLAIKGDESDITW